MYDPATRFESEDGIRPKWTFVQSAANGRFVSPLPTFNPAGYSSGAANYFHYTESQTAMSGDSKKCLIETEAEEIEATASLKNSLLLNVLEWQSIGGHPWRTVVPNKCIISDASQSGECKS